MPQRKIMEDYNINFYELLCVYLFVTYHFFVCVYLNCRDYIINLSCDRKKIEIYQICDLNIINFFSMPSAQASHSLPEINFMTIQLVFCVCHVIFYDF